MSKENIGSSVNILLEAVDEEISASCSTLDDPLYEIIFLHKLMKRIEIRIARESEERMRRIDNSLKDLIEEGNE